ncbi:MAG: Trk-type K+ transport system, membrane component [halophilic archaeon J07HX5]|jgi:Trk-type K+ transport systems, membrane components|nr:MAG: Trk-type K+ transport system, membrane component [halophilic archaeon J07HX5]
MNLRVEWRQSVALTGTVIKYISASMLLPLGVSLVYGEDTLVFVTAIGVVAAVGLVLEQAASDTDLGRREAFLFVALVWGAVAVIGAVPYLIAGFRTSSTVGLSVASPAAFLESVTNALFESMSGFTTTGSTVLGEISFERHSHALLMWRQLTQWLGGMGIIVLMVAILPEIAANGAQLIDSETPGPELQKLTPKIVETARLLWLFYIAFTALYIALLYGLAVADSTTGVINAPEMNLYNAIAHGLTTLPTGGFSPQADSIAAFSPTVQWVVVPFMIVAGVNFALFYFLLQGEYRSFLRDREFQAYVGAVLGLVLILWGLLFNGAAEFGTVGSGARGVVNTGALERSLRQAAFQIGSLMNSTGYATSNFEQWDEPAQLVLLVAFFIGGSAGSTGGGIKVLRWLIILKTGRRALFSATHPDAVRPIRLGGRVIDEDAVRAVFGFTLLYLLVFAVASVLIGLDSTRIANPDFELEIIDIISASIATLGNIGPGFGPLGPFGSFEPFPTTSKLLMIGLMWIGRLEIIPVLVLFTGAFWTR